MDVALKNGLRLSPRQALEKIEGIVDQVEKVKGDLISVWHNESLSDEMEWRNWRKVYEQSLEYISQKNKRSYHTRERK